MSTTVESLLSSYTDTSTTTTSSESITSSLDSDAFLELLLTEIEYQDPLNPMDSTEFVTQLAEFSELEQLTAIAGGMEDVVEAMDNVESYSAINYLGKDVVAEGNSVALEDGAASTVSFTLEEDAETVYAIIYGSDGNITDTTLIGSLEAGEYEYEWDGLDYNGSAVEDGTYSFSLYALDADGKQVDSTTSVAGTVTGIEETDAGTLLTLDDGRTVYLSNVTSVVTS